MYMNVVIKDYTVFNPNFYEDVLRFMKLQCTKEEIEVQINSVNATHPLSAAQIEAGGLSLKEKLNALIDRVEFTHHLEIVSRFAVQSNFDILGQEVRGIHWDIGVLRLYLALTCIDVFCEAGSHREQFERAFSDATGDIATTIETKLWLQKGDGTKGSKADIGLFFYNVRNFYTHMGKRFHILENCSFRQEQSFASGSMKHKTEQTLMLDEGVNLVDLIMQVALGVARRQFGW